MAHDDTFLEFGDFRLSRGERSLLTAAGTPIQLTRRLYDVLLYMVERPGRLLEKQALMDAVWKGAVVEENTLSRTISNLRQLLGERGGEHRYIETVSGIGYRFVAAVTVRAERPPEPPVQHRAPSIAVLAFADLSHDRDQGYFADGIAEEVLNRLATVRGLRVTAKSSAFCFRDGGESARAIGSALGVDYLLSGAVRKEGRALRITAQLVDAASDTQRWSQRFDRTAELEDVFAIQDDIARAVAHALRAVVGGGGEPAPTESGTRDPQAYDLFLRGRALVEQGGAHAALRSAELFRSAVNRDPAFAAGWLSLALASRAQLVFAPQRSAQAMEDAREASGKVLELAPNWWATHMVQSWQHHFRRDWLAMEQSLRKARELAPEPTRDVEFNLGTFHTQVSEPQRAIDHFRIAARMDPLSLLVCGLLQKELIIAGRHEEAEAEYRRSLDLAGDREMVEHLALHARWARGEPFREQFRRYLDLTESKPAPVLHEVYAVCEDPARALEKLRAATAAPEYQVAPYQILLAWWLAAYGDVESAFASMWRGFVDFGYVNVSWLWFPVFKRTREHARFPELVERVGLTAYWRAKNR